VVEETDKSAAVPGTVENLQREDLTPVELAMGIRELATAFDLSVDQIGLAISKTPSRVRLWLRMSSLPTEILEKIVSGEGHQQEVKDQPALSPRHIEAFVRDMPSEEEARRSPEAAALRDDRVASIGQLQDEVEKRGVHINAHMADEVARRVKQNKATVGEAVEAVLANPELYRTSLPYQKPSELQEDTWASYKEVHDEMKRLAYELKPTIAVGFSLPQKADLSERLLGLLVLLEPYRLALEFKGDKARTGLLELGEAKPGTPGADTPSG